MLANVDTELGVPVIALLFDMSAPAILDLLSLGVTDFVRAPACPHELRARFMSLQRRARPTSLTGPDIALRMSRLPLESGRYSAHHIARAPGRHAARLVYEPPVAHESPLKSNEKVPSVCLGEVIDVRSTDEPFRQAKARVVEGFERAYLRRALSRHSGNVAQAARASCKHRRAFWALMRKHQIDAAHYRIDDAFLDSLSEG